MTEPGRPGLGFGCSGLMARLDRRQSRTLLETAFSNGITHFDVARLYGYGEAEQVVGDFIAGRRSRVTVTTKVGIAPPRRSGALRAARALARRVAQVHPSVRAAIRRRAEAMTSAGRFDTVSMRSSLEASLAALRTDHVDHLLLHDCTTAELDDPEIAAFLGGLRDRGVILSAGVASAFGVAARAHAEAPDLFRTVQFPNSVWQDHMPAADWPGPVHVVTHSVFGAPFGALLDRLAADAGLAWRWRERLGFDCTDRTRLGEAFLSAALAANPAGHVLFSTQRPQAVASNARVVPRPDLRRTLSALVSDLAAEPATGSRP